MTIKINQRLNGLISVILGWSYMRAEDGEKRNTLTEKGIEKRGIVWSHYVKSSSRFSRFVQTTTVEEKG